MIVEVPIEYLANAVTPDYRRPHTVRVATSTTISILPLRDEQAPVAMRFNGHSPYAPADRELRAFAGVLYESLPRGDGTGATDGAPAFLRVVDERRGGRLAGALEVKNPPEWRWTRNGPFAPGDPFLLRVVQDDLQARLDAVLVIAGDFIEVDGRLCRKAAEYAWDLDEVDAGAPGHRINMTVRANPHPATPHAPLARPDLAERLAAAMFPGVRLNVCGRVGIERLDMLPAGCVTCDAEAMLRRLLERHARDQAGSGVWGAEASEVGEALASGAPIREALERVPLLRDAYREDHGVDVLGLFARVESDEDIDALSAAMAP